MFSRLSQVARHLSRPLPNSAHSSSAAATTLGRLAMATGQRSAASPDERNRRTIHTAGCIIIGDEVLGGKVGSGPAPHVECNG